MISKNLLKSIGPYFSTNATALKNVLFFSCIFITLSEFFNSTSLKIHTFGIDSALLADIKEIKRLLELLDLADRDVGSCIILGFEDGRFGLGGEFFHHGVCYFAHCL
jgi:hypothetical protein